MSRRQEVLDQFLEMVVLDDDFHTILKTRCATFSDDADVYKRFSTTANAVYDGTLHLPIPSETIAGLQLPENSELGMTCPTERPDLVTTHFVLQDTATEIFFFFPRPRGVYVEFRDRSGKVLSKKGPPAAFHHLVSIERNCFSNCLMNLKTFQSMAQTSLEITAGSLGLSIPQPTWFEWGGSGAVPHTLVHQFTRCPHTHLPDVHFWLESPDGRIYDVLDAYLLHTVAPTFRKRIDATGFPHGCVISGLCREELASRGLVYIPASPLVQETLRRKHLSNIKIIPFS